MTKNTALKKAARERAEQTGEKYTQALRHVMAAAQTPELAATDSETLWGHALADAQLLVGNVERIAYDPADGPNGGYRYMPPGVDESSMLPPALSARAARLRDRPRVLVAERPANAGGPGEVPIEIAELALMRAALEFHRYYKLNAHVYRFSGWSMDALIGIYGNAGPGSGIIYNLVPMVRSANAASAQLVAKTFGRQDEYLEDQHYGIMLRTTEQPIPPHLWARRSVVFAAIWPEQLENEAERRLHELEDLLDHVDPRALQWWKQLAANRQFTWLARQIRESTPSRDEIEAAASPIEAWRPLARLIVQAVDYGMALTAELSPVARELLQLELEHGRALSVDHQKLLTGHSERTIRTARSELRNKRAELTDDELRSLAA